MERKKTIIVLSGQSYDFPSNRWDAASLCHFCYSFDCSFEVKIAGGTEGTDMSKSPLSVSEQRLKSVSLISEKEISNRKQKDQID